MVDSHDLPKPPPPLPSPIRLILALACLAATQQPVSQPSPSTKQWYEHNSRLWLRSVLKLLSLSVDNLPPAVTVEAITASAEEQSGEWSEAEKSRMAGTLVEASLAGDPDKSDKDKEKEKDALKYTPLARALSHRTLELLGLPAKDLLPAAEKNLSLTLFKALQASQEGAKDKVEESRAAQSQGWGGKLGRQLATGAGVIAGGVLIGVTGGLAAPAIAALLAPLGVGSLLAGGAAPVVLGTLFGVGGGGLAGKRVRERWKGVEEFGFVEVGDGTKATMEEIEDLKEAKQKVQAKKAEEEAEAAKAGTEKASDGLTKTQEGLDDLKIGEKASEKKSEESGEMSEAQAAKEVEADQLKLQEKLLQLSAQAGNRTSISLDSSRSSIDSPRPSLDHPAEEKDLTAAKKPPSLTATIVVPGLLTVSKTEAITAWRAICSSKAPVEGNLAPAAEPRHKTAGGDSAHAETPSLSAGLKDGRDVYLLRFESAAMLKTGRDVNMWVTSKIKGKIKGEIIKRTVLSAYFAAVALPMTAYNLASMGLDNTWMHAHDRAKKAGRLLGEVLEKRVQGERPVILIGSSLGALTILTALQYLADLPVPPGNQGQVPAYVESAYFISLPSAPSAEEWAKVRKVVSRRVVNAWSEADWVLAGVVRLHEVVSRAATLSSGVQVAGLGPVNQPGVQDIDVSSVLRGHMELQTKMGEVMRIIDVDA